MRPAIWRAAVGILAVAVAWVWWQRLDCGVAPEITRFRDDAYYYFAWARSLAAGDGPCVTAGVPTSGVHFLWGSLLAAVAWVLGADAVPAAAHALGLTGHVVAAAWLWFGFRRLGWAAVAGALLYLGNPVLLTEAQNGQETALAGLASVWLLTAWSGGGRGFVVAGVVATLARSDLFVLVACLAVARHGRSVRTLVGPSIAFAAYLATTWCMGGTWIQDSASPIPWLFEDRYRSTDPGLGDEVRRFWWWVRPCLFGSAWKTVSTIGAGVLLFVASDGLRRRWRVVPLLLTGVAWGVGASDLEPMWVASVLIAVLPRAVEGARLPARALVVGWLAILLIHHVVRHYPRPYYFAPMGGAVFAACVVLAARRPRAGLVVLLAAAGTHSIVATAEPERRAWQREQWMAGTYARDLVGDVAIGSFNAGLVTWEHPGRVVNLDGVVNRPAFEALRERRLSAYLDREAVCLVADVPAQFAEEAGWPHASGRHFAPGFSADRDLIEIARFDVPGASGGWSGTGCVALYWRPQCGEPPMLPRETRLLGRSRDGRAHVAWEGPAGSELTCVAPDGRRHSLVRGRPGVVQVVEVPTIAPGRYSLHEGDGERPILVIESP